MSTVEETRAPKGDIPASSDVSAFTPQRPEEREEVRAQDRAALDEARESYRRLQGSYTSVLENILALSEHPSLRDMAMRLLPEVRALGAEAEGEQHA